MTSSTQQCPVLFPAGERLENVKHLRSCYMSHSMAAVGKFLFQLLLLCAFALEKHEKAFIHWT